MGATLADWNSRGLFIAVLFESILSFIFWSGGLLCVNGCIILCGGSSPGFMNEPTLRQRLGDGSDPAMMSLLKWREEKGAL